MSYLELRNISLSYTVQKQHTPVLRDINLSVEQGIISALVGPSGSGKSSLLLILAGIIEGYEGEAYLSGTKLNPRQHQIALVPQNYGLMPWKTLYENITLPLSLGRRSVSNEERDEIISALGISDILQRYPHQVSGGQRQRVALARAFAMKPDLLLLDEAFSALDVVSAERSRQLFRELWGRYPCTTLLVTHNPTEAVNLASEVFVLSGNPGRLQSQLHLPSEALLREHLQQAYLDEFD